MNLELRKEVLEALGWSVRRYSEDLHLENPQNFTIARRWGPSEPLLDGVERLWHDAPGIESDPAVSEPMLDELCDKQGWYWDCRRITKQGKLENYVCRIGNIGTGPSASVIEFGATPSEARAKAILAALRHGTASVSSVLGEI